MKNYIGILIAILLVIGVYFWFDEPTSMDEEKSEMDQLIEENSAQKERINELESKSLEIVSRDIATAITITEKFLEAEDFESAKPYLIDDSFCDENNFLFFPTSTIEWHWIVEEKELNDIYLNEHNQIELEYILMLGHPYGPSQEEITFRFVEENEELKISYIH